MRTLFKMLLAGSLALGAAWGPSSEAATFYWDVNGATAGTGGTGTWQDATGNWSTDTAGTLPTTWTNANRDIADFRGTAGTVTVSGGVTAASVVFNAGGYSLQGGTITIGRPTGTSDLTLLRSQTGTGNNTIANNIVVDDVGTVGSSVAYIIQNDTASELILNGNLSVSYASGTPAGTKTFSLRANTASSTIRLNGSISAPVAGTTQSLQFFGAGTYYVSGDNSAALTAGTGGQVVKGTVYLQHDKAVGNNAIQIGVSSTFGSDTAALLTDGARTITNNMSLGGAAAASQLIVGGSSAHTSTFSGNFNMGSSVQTLRLSAVAGGRVDFSGSYTGSGTGTLIKQGAGIAALTRATGNTYSRSTSVNAGTLLIMNTSGSATGTGTVSVAGGAALGGTGISTGLVTTSSATSTFTPGNMTVAGVSSTGTLTLSGGLNADNGATFELQLGTSSDLLNLASGVFTGSSAANGLLFNFSDSGGLLAGNPYTIITFGSSIGLDYSDLLANVLPSGYTLDSSFGTGGFQINGSNLQVQFAAVPEPSTYALFGMGLTALWVLRRKKSA